MLQVYPENVSVDTAVEIAGHVARAVADRCETLTGKLNVSDLVYGYLTDTDAIYPLREIVDAIAPFAAPVTDNDIDLDARARRGMFTLTAAFAAAVTDVWNSGMWDMPLYTDTPAVTDLDIVERALLRAEHGRDTWEWTGEKITDYHGVIGDALAIAMYASDTDIRRLDHGTPWCRMTAARLETLHMDDDITVPYVGEVA